MTHSDAKRRGFTLAELAIVFMIVGLVTSIIWVAGQRVWLNYRVYRVNQQVAQVVQNIRGYYGTTIQNWGTPGFSAGQDITANLDKLLPGVAVFPAEMRRNPSAGPGATPIDHAINNSYTSGSFHVLVEQNAITAKLDTFRLALQGLSTATCVQLLMTAPISSDVINLVQVGTGGMATSAVITKGTTTTAGVIPMTPSTASAWCGSASEVDFDFPLQN